MQATVCKDSHWTHFRFPEARFFFKKKNLQHFPPGRPVITPISCFDSPPPMSLQQLCLNVEPTHNLLLVDSVTSAYPLRFNIIR